MMNQITVLTGKFHCYKIKLQLDADSSLRAGEFASNQSSKIHRYTFESRSILHVTETRNTPAVTFSKILQIFLNSHKDEIMQNH